MLTQACSGGHRTLRLGLIRSAPRIIQATAFTLLAAGLRGPSAFAALSLLWFVVGVLLCGTLASVAKVSARRDRCSREARGGRTGTREHGLLSLQVDHSTP